MTSTTLLVLAFAALAETVLPADGPGNTDDLAKGFVTPPDAARPWVYWFWLDGNVTREGITADLEAMRRVGIGGVLIMEVDQGVPRGPVRFMSPQWRELFKHAVTEAGRLGLEVNMANDAGWSGSGGPWIKPEHAMQAVVSSETNLQGPRRFEGMLLKPPASQGFYRDIAVLAFPTPARPEFRIENYPAKAGYTRLGFQPGVQSVVSPEMAIRRDRVIDLSARLEQDGRFAWDVPEGNWTLLRIGHTPTGQKNRPAPAEGTGLECDKLSREAIEAHFAGFLGELIADIGPLAGKTLTFTHIDSWEVGSQNWTARFREEFQNRRGYDLFPFLPVITGRVVESLEVSERFLWDVRRTIADLIAENYAGHLQQLSQRHGMSLSIEAYGKGTFDNLSYAGRADVPMAEFWVGGGMLETCKAMASAAHVYGKPIVAAESFTANPADAKWQNHPFSLKPLGDSAFCEGVNRFVFHRYALQPWLDRKPGMTMGPWGTHYERTETWWDQTSAWHEYLTRCQFLLQQGHFVADICYLCGEGAPNDLLPESQLNAIRLAGYNYDGCTAEVVLTHMAVKEGRLVLPHGMSYRVLVLPRSDTMTPPLLRKIKALVEAGATVVGPRPVRSPSLAGYPKCDEEVKRLAAELWGDCDGKKVLEHRCGQGKVVWGKSLEQLFADMAVPPDFRCRGGTTAADIRYIHRAIAGAEVYFLANGGRETEHTVCSFRVHGRCPELWWPDTGRMERLAGYDEADGGVRVPIRFDPCGSVFVVFRPAAATPPDKVVSVMRNGEVLLSTPAARANNTNVASTFTMVLWVRPEADITLPTESTDGIAGSGDNRNDALYPPPGHQVYGTGHAGCGISAGRNGVCVYEHSAQYFAAPLVARASLTSWTHLAVVYRGGEPLLYINGKLARKGLKSRMTVHPGVGVLHDVRPAAFKGNIHTLQQINRALTEAEIARLMESTAPDSGGDDLPDVEIVQGEGENLSVQVRLAGTYEIQTARGKSLAFEAPSIGRSLEIPGPWNLRFPAGWGAPERVTLEKLISWTDHNDPGVRCFSGAATYSRQIVVPAEMIGKERRVFLDLGRVRVIAQVNLNAKEVGILWKEPFRVDVTDAVKAGENVLEIRVVNLWPNRLIGDEQLPDDCEWRESQGTAGRPLLEWPTWLLEGKPRPSGRYTFSTWKHWTGDSPLLESGLLGPVILRPAVKIAVRPP